MTASKGVLKIAVEEQRFVAQKLHDDYNHMKARILTYLGGGLASLIFLYSREGTARGALFIPDEIYGKIFYFAAIAMVVTAISLLLHALTAGTWEVPTENAKLESLDTEDETEYLLYVKNRYVICYSNNVRVYASKQKLLNAAFYPLIFGVIILVVLNLFGG